MENVVDKQSGGIEINLENLINMIIKKWFLILIFGVVFAVAGIIVAEVTGFDTFSSSIVFIVSNRDLAAAQTADSISAQDITASIDMTNNFKYLLTGSTMIQEIQKTLEKQGTVMDLADITSAISIKSITDTSIIEMSIETKSAALSKAIADALVANYEKVVAVYQGARINVYAKPELAKFPNKNSSMVRNGAIGAVVGLALSVIIIALTNAVKDTIHSADDIREKLELNIMGTVSQIGKNNKKVGELSRSLLISEKATGFGFIETYKAIRTKIEGVAAKNGYKTFVVSSAVENEGKTTVATNIALALAQNGKTVLLIDADIRKPSICKLLGIPNVKEKGLPDVINGVCTVDKAIRYVEKYKLFILAGSMSSQNPTELLSMPQTGSLIKSLENDFDFILIDTPPAGVITDASIISNYADALILVIREDEAPISRINMAISDLTSSGTDLIGCVYNNVITGTEDTAAADMVNTGMAADTVTAVTAMVTVTVMVTGIARMKKQTVLL
jgi:receptor protein-tyrosine kinase